MSTSAWEATPLAQRCIVVPGPPVPKPRQSQRDKWAQRPCVMRYRAWADLVRVCAAGHGRAASYEFRFYLLIPASYTKAKRAWLSGRWHDQKPDLDNLVKAAIDALLPDGDEKVYRIVATKFWAGAGGPRTEIIPVRVEVEAA